MTGTFGDDTPVFEPSGERVLEDQAAFIARTVPVFEETTSEIGGDEKTEKPVLNEEERATRSQETGKLRIDVRALRLERSRLFEERQRLLDIGVDPNELEAIDGAEATKAIHEAHPLRQFQVNVPVSEQYQWDGDPRGKDSNPKDAIGSRKVGLSMLPRQVLYEVALAMLEGSLKYARHNYRIAGVRASVYYDANGRHLDAWWEGQDNDPGSGLHHIVKAIASLVVLRDSMLAGNWSDDRPPSIGDPNWLSYLNKEAERIIDAFEGEPKQPYIKGDNE